LNTKSIITDMNANTEKRTIEGYASIFGNIDSHKDIVMGGAFKKTLNENGNRIKLLWQHNINEPIGKPVKISEDSKGLYFEAKISNTTMGNNALELVKDGVLNEMSIGYDPIKDEWDSKRNVRLLREIKLYEISVVTFASNADAQISGVKMDMFAKLIEELKAGRAISQQNQDKIRTAVDALNALIEVEVEKPEDVCPECGGAIADGTCAECGYATDGCGGKPNMKSHENIIDPKIFQSMMDEVNRYK
jgi:HK97 family phage prohead protease